MASGKKGIDGKGEAGNDSRAITKSKKGNEMAEPRSLAIAKERPKTSGDLATIAVDGVYDSLAGAISVGQGNLILNMVGKVIQIKKLEMQLSAIKHHIESKPFVLPGVK